MHALNSSKTLDLVCQIDCNRRFQPYKLLKTVGSNILAVYSERYGNCTPEKKTIYLNDMVYLRMRDSACFLF